MANPKSLTGQYLSGEMAIPMPKADAAASRRRPARRSRCRRPREQSKKRRRRDPAGHVHLRHRRFRRRQVDLLIETLYKAAARRINMAPATCRPSTTGSRAWNSSRQGHRHRPIADRPHAALQPGHLYRRLHADPRMVRRPAGGQGARLQARPLSPSTSRAAAARPARATASSRSRCTSCRTSTSPATSARASATTARRWSRFKGKSIADVLDMTVEEGVRVLRRRAGRARQAGDPAAGRPRLYQCRPAGRRRCLGGEAQRVKLAKELSRAPTGRTLYILDEPTTGLHFHDVAKLLEVLHELVDQGNTVVVIEHNLEVKG